MIKCKKFNCAANEKPWNEFPCVQCGHNRNLDPIADQYVEEEVKEIEKLSIAVSALDKINEIIVAVNKLMRERK